MTLKFEVESCTSKPTSNLRYGSTSFPYYLMGNKLFVDIWDGDTLLYLGTAIVNLENALRQGRSAVSFEQDVDIKYTEVFGLLT